MHTISSRDPNKYDTILDADNEDFVVKDFMETHPSNSSSCIGGFLVDPVLGNCANFNFSINVNDNELDSNFPSDTAPLKIIAPDLEQKSGAHKHAGKVNWTKMNVNRRQNLF